jgi:hypothetical protein
VQRTKQGSLLLEVQDVGRLIHRLRETAKACHETNPDVTAEMHRLIDEFERGIGDVIPGVDLEVHGGRTFRRNAFRVVDQTTWPTMVGELDGVRVYCRERGGRVKVIMSKDDLYE